MKPRRIDPKEYRRNNCYYCAHRLTRIESELDHTIRRSYCPLLRCPYEEKKR